MPRRPLWTVAALLAALLPAGADAQPDGDNLPRHARARFGGSGIERIRRVSVSPDGRLVATCGEPGDPRQPRIVRLWDARTGEPLRTLTAHDEPVRQLLFAPDGSVLVSVAEDHPRGTQVWNPATGKLLHGLPGGNGKAAFLDPSRLAVVDRFGHRDVVRVHDVRTGNEVQRFVVETNHDLAFSRDGKRFLSLRSDRSTDLRLYELETGKVLAKFTDSESEPDGLCLAPDGRTAAAIDRDEILVWEVATEKPVHRMAGHEGRVHRLTFTRDGRRLVSCGADGTVRLWDVATGEELERLAGHDERAVALALSADAPGRLVSGSFDRTAVVWDLAGTRKTTLPEEPPAAKELESAWRDLAANGPRAAYRAIGRGLQHDATVLPWLRQRVTGILEPAENERIVQLVKDLDDPDFVVRHRATASLRKLRNVARPVLLEAFDRSTSAEVRYRIRRILSGTEDLPRFTSADELRMLRLIHLAESAGGEHALAILQTIADDFPVPRIADEARSTLKRLQGGRS